MLTARLNKIVSQQKGFTLVELLVVIAILGILAVGLIAAINPVDKLAQASDARAISDIGVLARASEAYSTNHNGFYELALTDLTNASELKVVPTAPTGYTYNVINTPNACTAGTTCTALVIWTTMKSSKYSANTTLKYESLSGKTCWLNGAATAANECP